MSDVVGKAGEEECMTFERTECAMHRLSPGVFPARRPSPSVMVSGSGRTPKNAGALFQEALVYLRESGFRVTKPREVIVRAAISFSEPFNAEDLLSAARRMDRLISLATVYRTLPMLLDSRLIREVELNREHRYYEVNREQSPAAFHIVCSDCRQVLQVHYECIPWHELFLANSLGFKPLNLTLLIVAAPREPLE